MVTSSVVVVDFSASSMNAWVFDTFLFGMHREEASDEDEVSCVFGGERPRRVMPNDNG